MMNFYQFMKKARGSMSLWELSKRTGITVQQLSNYEKEKARQQSKRLLQSAGH